MKLFFKNTAGLFTLAIDGWKNGYCLHFFPKKGYREWGYSEDWYDGPYYSYGLGPFLLLCWMENE